MKKINNDKMNPIEINENVEDTFDPKISKDDIIRYEKEAQDALEWMYKKIHGDNT